MFLNENEKHQLLPIRGKKINHEIELLEKNPPNGHLGPVIQYIKKRIPGIKENIDRISG